MSAIKFSLNFNSLKSDEVGVMVYRGIYCVGPEKNVFSALVGGFYQRKLDPVLLCSLHLLVFCFVVLSVVEGPVLKFPVLTADLLIFSVLSVFIPRIFLCCLVHSKDAPANYVHLRCCSGGLTRLSLCEASLRPWWSSLGPCSEVLCT